MTIIVTGGAMGIFTRPGSGPLFCLKHRNEIHGFQRLAGLVVLG